MSSNSIPVTVRIAEKEYKISCPEGEHEILQASARRVSNDMKKMRESGKALGAEKIAVMVALNIAHELINAHGSSGTSNADDPYISDQLESLQQTVNAALQTYAN
ncbi:MAG: cell division protein ZapA [Cocleimonas sp.]